ncbi:MAG: NTP transferase domain-containing protein [Bacteroidota bacterium]
MQLNGLVLIGGKSSRMGIDKSQIAYHGKAHRCYLSEQLLAVGCEQVYWSCSKTDVDTPATYPIIRDQYEAVGPIAAVLAAFELNRLAAYFILGCDYPLIDESTLKQLINARNTAKQATIFQHPESRYLEPLLAIYEPSAFAAIRVAFESGQKSLRKILNELEVQIVIPNQPNKLVNANTPAQRDATLRDLEILRSSSFED